MTDVRIAKLKVLFLLLCPVMFVGYHAAHFASGVFFSNTQLRTHVDERIPLDQLQAWAMESLEGHETDEISVELLPGQVRKLKGSVHIVEAHDDTPRHILVVLGRGFQHAGVRIGPPGFKPYPDTAYHFDEWISGVWGQVER